MRNSMRALLSFIPLSWLLLLHLGSADDLFTRCYGEYGCFTNAGQFICLSRPLNDFPQAPEVISPVLSLYTRANPTTSQLLNVNDVSGLSSTNFNTLLLTKMFIHGYQGSGSENNWYNDMRDEFLELDNFNIIYVDWQVGAAGTYRQATANARLIGAMLAKFLQLLQAFGYQTQKVHILGHSLGAHVAGYTGERLDPKLGRITGLDPAGPWFENCAPVVRLDPTDATFVDVMHTDGGSLLLLDLGTLMQMGHVDFYPNGGNNQPGCFDNVLSVLTKGICNHLKVLDYFKQSINDENIYLSYPCSSYTNFLLNQCSNCGITGYLCAHMGFHAIDYLDNNEITQPVKFYLTIT